MSNENVAKNKNKQQNGTQYEIINEFIIKTIKKHLFHAFITHLSRNQFRVKGMFE